MTAGGFLGGHPTQWLFEALPRAAPGWLVGERWFAGKTRAVESVDVEDVFWLAHEETPTALVVLVVRQSGAAAVHDDRYTALIGLRRHPTGPIIADVDGHGVVDVSVEGTALRALIAHLRDDAAMSGAHGGSLMFADLTARARDLLTQTPPPTVTPIGKEQSNTSVRLGEMHVFKLFRRLEAGEHPQIEIGRFLARSHFRHAPPLEGSITYLARDGSACALGALEGWIENLGDGWSDAVASLTAARHDEAPEDLVARIALLGTTTAEFHLAMAGDPTSPAFAPEPVTADDRRAWSTTVREQCDRVLTLVERHAARWAEPGGALARRVVAGRTEIARRVWRLTDSDRLGGCDKIRVHGDFHLGQTLRTPTGYVLIDFEGEPAKTLDRRRHKQVALKDVAGMLRSLEYAVASARPGLAVPTMRAVSRRLREAYLNAYLARVSADGTTALPGSPKTLDAWLRFFEIDKTLYEVEYEANNRPSWVHIPLAALVEALEASGSEASL